MSMVFVASIYLLIGLVLGVVIGALASDAGRSRSRGKVEATAVDVARILDKGQTISVSTIISKSREEEEEEEDTREPWRYN